MPIAMLIPLLLFAAVVARTETPVGADRMQGRLTSQAVSVAHAAHAVAVVGVGWMLRAP